VSAGNIKTRDFPPPSHDGFGFVEIRDKAPNRTENILSGAKQYLMGSSTKQPPG